MQPAYNEPFSGFTLRKFDGHDVPTLTYPESLTEQSGPPGRLSLARQCTAVSEYQRLTHVLDDFDGVTRDNDGNAYPLVQRNFSPLSQTEAENGQSRSWVFSTAHPARVSQ